MNDFNLEPLRIKSHGKTISEMLLHRLCEEKLLSMWCFSNPFTIMKTKKELCDVLVVFKNHVFLFSDKQVTFQINEPIEKSWNRWYRNAIWESAKQLVGAEKQIKENPDNIFVDKDCTIKFPFRIRIDENTRFHRIVVARGSKEACQAYYQDAHGSLAINSQIVGDKHFFAFDRDGKSKEESAIPFFVGYPLDTKTVFHVFDDFTIDIILKELDSLPDFADYLTEKEKVLESGNELFAYGEEDILAYYLSTVENDHHVLIKTEDNQKKNVLYKYEDLWDMYIQDEQYREKKTADDISYLWDSLIEKFYRNIISETAEAMTFDRYDQLNELFVPFAELRRIERRMVSQAILSGYTESAYKLKSDNPNNIQTLTRTVMSSLSPGKYCILVFAAWPNGYSVEKYKKKRRELLEFSLRVCKYRNPQAQQIMGLAFSNDRTKDSSEDMMVMNVNAWTEEDDREVRFMLEHGVNDVLGRRGFCTSTEEYSEAVKVNRIDFPWKE